MNDLMAKTRPLQERILRVGCLVFAVWVLCMAGFWWLSAPAWVDLSPTQDDVGKRVEDTVKHWLAVEVKVMPGTARGALFREHLRTQSVFYRAMISPDDAVRLIASARTYRPPSPRVRPVTATVAEWPAIRPSRTTPGWWLCEGRMTALSVVQAGLGRLDFYISRSGELLIEDSSDR